MGKHNGYSGAGGGHQLLVADALAAALSWSPSLSVLKERLVSGVEAIETAARLHPDVVLVDYWMPDMSRTAKTEGNFYLIRRLGHV